MKIDTKLFKKYSRFLGSFQDKANEIRESTFFDFTNGYAYLLSKNGLAKVKLTLGENKEEVPNFFVNTAKLLSITGAYEELDIDETFTFKSGKDSFNLGSLTDDTDMIDTTIFNDSYVDGIDFNSEEIGKLLQASKFCDKEVVTYQGVFYSEGYLASLSTSTPFFEVETGIKQELMIPEEVVSIITSIGDEFELFINPTKKKIKVGDELEIIIADSNQMVKPPFRSEAFIKGYSHADFIEVDSSSLATTLAFLKPFYNNTSNTKIKISLEDKDDVSIYVEDASKNVLIKKSFELQEISENLVGSYFYISAEKLSKVISTINDKQIIVSINLALPVINFIGKTRKDSHMVIARIGE